MKKAILSAVLWMFFMGVAVAAEEAQKQTSGFGETYQAALTDALLNAVRQVRGMEVGTEKTLRFDLSAIVTDDKAVMSGGSRVAVDVYSRSHGWIKTYRVLAVKKPASKDDVWQVDVEATIPIYKQAVPEDQRKRIVILPFRINPAEFRVEVEKDSAADVVVQIADGLSRVFTQSGQLAVLNRAFKSEFADERSLWSSEQVPPAEASRLGEKLGADFVLVGNLYKFDISHKAKEYYGADLGGQYASIELSYALVEAATEKLIWTDKRIFSLPLKEEKSLVKEIDPHVVSEVVDTVVAAISTELLDVMYPVKVMEIVNAEQILLNQGRGRLQTGQRMAVYTEGRSVTDPDSGRKIQTEGREVAQLEITAVKDRYSVAKLVSGELSEVQVKAIARPLKATEKAAPKTDRTPGSSAKPWSW